jgi:tetratricopeptide (TPR) repeat protein
MDASVAEVHATLGVIDFKLGSFDRAVEEIRAARKLKPALPGLESLLAMSLAESGKNREALPGLEKAFHSAADPEVRRQAGLELTAVYGRLQMDRRAAETALALRDLYKDDPEVLYTVGKVLGNSAYLTMQSLFHGAGGPCGRGWHRAKRTRAKASIWMQSIAIAVCWRSIRNA